LVRQGGIAGYPETNMEELIRKTNSLKNYKYF